VRTCPCCWRRFYAEDYTEIGGDAESFFAFYGSIGLLLTSPFLVSIGKAVDRTGPVRWLVIPCVVYACNAFGAQFTTSTLYLAPSTVFRPVFDFLQSIAVTPFIVFMLKDPIYMTRDVCGFFGCVWPVTGACSFASTVLLDMIGHTDEVMSNGRKQYVRSAFYAVGMYCGVLMLCGAALLHRADRSSRRVGGGKTFEESVMDIL